MGFVLAMVLEIAVIVGVGFFCFSMLASFRRDAPFVPTGRREVEWIVREVAKIKRDEVVYDLGSGDGRVVRAAARLGARATGFEQLRVLVAWAHALVVISNAVRNLTPSIGQGVGSLGVPRDDVCFVRGNFLTADLSRADVIFCYLMPGAMVKLKEKFERELRPGARVISRAFKIPGWDARERLKFSKHSPPVYVYIK